MVQFHSSIEQPSCLNVTNFMIIYDRIVFLNQDHIPDDSQI